MLDPLDRLVLPAGVRLEGCTVVDEVRGARFPANAAASELLEGADEPLERAAERLSDRWGIPAGQARHDALRFAWQLNGLALANVLHARGRWSRVAAWLRIALRLLPAGRLPEPVVRRRALDTTTVTRAIASVLLALGPRAAALGVALAAALALVGVSAGGAPPATALAVAAAAGGALLLHETAHVVGLVPARAAVLLVGGRTSILHAPLAPRRALLVALAGPFVPGLVGLALAVAGLVAEAPAASLAALPPAGHALAATVAGGDGRVACGLPLGRHVGREPS